MRNVILTECPFYIFSHVKTLDFKAVYLEIGVDKPSKNLIMHA